jgi:hypothetical protein
MKVKARSAISVSIAADEKSETAELEAAIGMTVMMET